MTACELNMVGNEVIWILDKYRKEYAVTYFENHLSSLSDKPSLPETEQERRRESFRQANASLRLSGFETDAGQLALQEEVIQGRLTIEEAIAQVIAKYSDNETVHAPQHSP